MARRVHCVRKRNEARTGHCVDENQNQLRLVCIAFPGLRPWETAKAITRDNDHWMLLPNTDSKREDNSLLASST